MSEFVALDNPRLWEAKRMRGGKSTASTLPTVGELERLQEQARREGRAEGLAEGRALAATEMARLKALTTALAEASAALEGEVTEGIVDLSLDVARAMLHEALQAKRERLLPVVREAM